MKQSLVAALAMVLSACPSPVRRPSSADVSLSGSVTWGGFDRRADPLGGVSISLWSSATPVRATSTSDGAWKLSTPAAEPAPATLSAWAAGFSPRIRSLRVGSSTELQLSFALEPLEPLECLDTSCTDSLGGLRWADAPSGARADALVLDETTAPAIPGADTLLVAAAVELDGGTATPLSGSLRLRIPKSSWRAVVDARPGSGAIEVSSGTLTPDDRAWRAGAEATLTTEAGLPIAETQLDAIRAGTFAPGVLATVAPLARGVVGVFGGPLERGCVEGSITIDGEKAPGLTVFPLEGQPAASNTSGTVCFEAPVSTMPQPARVQYAGVVYASTTIPAATQPGTCGSNTCRALGALSVRSDTTATVAPCSVSVRVIDEAQRPLQGAIVIGMDDGLTQAAFASICGRMGTRCTLTGATDANGAVSLVVPVLTGLELSAKAQTMSGARRGGARLLACPREPVTLTANLGRDTLTVNATFSQSTIEWTPAQPAFQVLVERDGGVVWSLRSTSGLSSPLTWGTTPSGAQVDVAAIGAPSVDDLVKLSFDGVQPSGVAISGAASAVRE
ncbi:MAG: hypothetical protein Q8S33_31910 [Myxococcales bacterium]|nr:hypothetical protein [Myxococcales bacterium]